MLLIFLKGVFWWFQKGFQRFKVFFPMVFANLCDFLFLSLWFQIAFFCFLLRGFMSLFSVFCDFVVTLALNKSLVCLNNFWALLQGVLLGRMFF